MKTARFLLRVAALSLIAAVPAIALAQTGESPAPVKTHAPHVSIHHPINVTECDPQRGTYMATGFTPAYYPVGAPYWAWPTVYPGYTYYQYPVKGDPTLSIEYNNNTDMVMKHIEFGLLAHGNLVAEVRDVGTFSPKAVIKHSFGLNPNVFPLQTSLVKCIPLKITFADGSKWKNPHLPRLNKAIYGKPHPH
jgi:hypothetical protein